MSEQHIDQEDAERPDRGASLISLVVDRLQGALMGEPLTEEAKRALHLEVWAAIVQAQCNEEDRYLEGCIYASLAHQHKEIGEEETAQMASDMSKLRFSLDLQSQHSNTAKSDMDSYSRLLRFARRWNDVVAKMTNSPPQFEAALDLIVALINEEQSYPGLIKTPSSLWKKRAECELALGLPLQANISTATRIACELRER